MTKIPRFWNEHQKSLEKAFRQEMKRGGDAEVILEKVPILLADAYQLSAIKEINLNRLGYPKKFMFIITFLENWNSLAWYKFNEYIPQLKQYHDLKHNNIWVEISYGKFSESSLRGFQMGILPPLHTIITISSSSRYFGPDKTTVDKDTLARARDMRWYGPGFFIHNVKSKDDLRNNILEMLAWIEDNGDWLYRS